ncbi:MAG: UPF0280 family protein [Candidatus Omnitrophica bacterium]|nr:UPF0280 family protein [Candidatus Omnitrophota bacterium]
MKTNKYQKRFYRDWAKSQDLRLARIAVKETDLQVFTNKPADEVFIKERVNYYRRNIEGYIAKDRRFLTALKPLEVELSAAPIVKRMAQAAKLANVGPMAAVAGAIAEFLGRDLLKKGHKDIIIENGGDIFIAASKARKVGIYAGKSKIWNRLSIQIKSEDTPLGICTSSGKIGHSLSFGLADAVTILSKNASLADAAATAVANRVNSQSDLQKAADFAKSIKGISGVIIIIKRHLISWGKVKFVK